MNLQFGRLALTSIIMGGMLSSCATSDKEESRHALLDHHVKMNALDELSELQGQPENHATSVDQIIASSDENPVSSQPEVIMPLGDPKPMVDDIGLAPDGPSKPFAADPADEVGLFPED